MFLGALAVARIVLDNVPHIKAYWIMLGIKTAQIALSFGADDLDGTVVHEKIYHDAGSDSPQELTVAELRRLIAEAGRVPMQLSPTRTAAEGVCELPKRPTAYRVELADGLADLLRGLADLLARLLQRGVDGREPRAAHVP